MTTPTTIADLQRLTMHQLRLRYAELFGETRAKAGRRSPARPSLPLLRGWPGGLHSDLGCPARWRLNAAGHATAERYYRRRAARPRRTRASLRRTENA